MGALLLPLLDVSKQLLVIIRVVAGNEGLDRPPGVQIFETSQVSSYVADLALHFRVDPVEASLLRLGSLDGLCDCAKVQILDLLRFRPRANSNDALCALIENVFQKLVERMVGVANAEYRTQVPE